MVKLCPIWFFVENWNILCQSSQWHSKMIPQIMKTLVFLVPFILANKPYCPFSEDIYSDYVFWKILILSVTVTKKFNFISWKPSIHSDTSNDKSLSFELYFYIIVPSAKYRSDLGIFFLFCWNSGWSQMKVMGILFSFEIHLPLFPNAGIFYYIINYSRLK